MVFYWGYRKFEPSKRLILPVFVVFRDMVRRTLSLFYVLWGSILRVPLYDWGQTHYCQYFVLWDYMYRGDCQFSKSFGLSKNYRHTETARTRSTSEFREHSQHLLFLVLSLWYNPNTKFNGRINVLLLIVGRFTALSTYWGLITLTYAKQLQETVTGSSTTTLLRTHISPPRQYIINPAYVLCPNQRDYRGCASQHKTESNEHQHIGQTTI